MPYRWAASIALLAAFPWSRPLLAADRDPRKPNDAARRAVAGAPSEADDVRGAESTELSALAEAERTLFAPASPPVGASWPNGLALSPTKGMHAPLESRASAPPPEEPIWVASLDLPDLPVRWDGRVVRYLQFFRDDARGHALLVALLHRSGRYATKVRASLRAQHLPEDLVWTALVESGFDPAAHSSAGARGLWQLMPEGAKVYGLVQNHWIDERLDPERATEAAAHYLADLHRRFGTWELALAAYNMGYGGLLAAIRKYNTNDYWALEKLEAALPWETTLYVPKILALAVAARNPKVFGLAGRQEDAPLLSDEVTVCGGVSLRAIAAAASVPVAAVEQRNPAFCAGRTPPQSPGAGEPEQWTVRVPAGKGATVRHHLARVTALEPELGRRTVRFGESIETMAASVGTTRARILALNGLRADEVVSAGTVLLVPPEGREGTVSSPRAERPVVVVPAVTCSADPTDRRVFYRVMTGDTLPAIAAAFHVTLDAIGRCNAIDPGARLYDGLVLQIFVARSVNLAQVTYMEASSVRALTVGSEEFFAYFEGLRGRKRTVVTVEEGDTWDVLAKRFLLTKGQLERINRRSRADKLIPGETVVVYEKMTSPAAPNETAPSSQEGASPADSTSAPPATDAITPSEAAPPDQ